MPAVAGAQESREGGPGAREAVAVAFSAAVGLVAANLLAWPLFALLGSPSWSAATRLGAGAVVAEIGLGLPVVFAILLGRLGFVAGLGLRRPRLAPTLYSLLAIAGGGVLLDEAMFLAVRLLPSLRSGDLEAVGGAIASAGPTAAVVLLVPLALAPAVVEEALCRGLLLRGLGRALPAWAALALSAAYFGGLHFDRLHSPIAFLMGLLLGFVALRTGSLWPAIACHLLNNSISVLVPAAGGPSLPDVMDHGLPAWLVAAGCAGLAAGLVGLVLSTRSDQEHHDRDGQAGRGEEERGEDGAGRLVGHQGPEGEG